MANIGELVEKYRHEIINGKIIDLAPLDEEYLSDVVRMRNHPKMMYYFNQERELTLDDQMEWYYNYLKRSDDIYWVIKNKDGKVIGTNRLYDIKSDRCEQGSLMVDEAYAMSAPYAAEAILLSLEFAYDILKVETVVNQDRHDNKNMNSITKRFGFKLLKQTDIRGVEFNYYELNKKKFRKQEVKELLQLWVDR